MDADKVIQDLNRRFAAPLPEFYLRRIIFWHDEDGEFEDKLDDVVINGVTIVRLTGNNTFAVKKLIHDDRTSNLLIYNPLAIDNPDNDWLMDAKLYSEEFRADLISMWMDEMEIVSTPAMRKQVKEYRKFFNAQSRRAKIMAQSSIPSTPVQLQKAVMAALCGIKAAVPSDILRCVLSAGLDDDFNSIYQDFITYGAKDAFWQMAYQGTGYFEDEPSIHRLAVHILLTASTRSMRVELLKGLDLLISVPHQSYCYDFVSDWSHSDENDKLYQIARRVEEEAKLTMRFSNYEISDIADTECFPCINEVILTKIMTDISNHLIDPVKITAIVEKRRAFIWYDEVKNYYEGIQFIANMQSFYKEHSGGFHLTNAKAIWKEYTTEYYKMDEYYRGFHLCFQRSLMQSNPELDDMFKHIVSVVEGLYTNWFLGELGTNWSNICADDLAVYGKIPEISQQVDFYNHRIKNADARYFVIISDALRYEVAVSLTEQLQREAQCQVKLDSMQGVFPTITKFGMAALLPHSSLSVEYKNEERLVVLADGQSTESNNRDRVLKGANPNSIALHYKNIIGMKRADRQELVKGMDVVYIYHDEIDEAAHGNESDVFFACDEAIQELKNLVRVIVNDFGAANIIITADHGFLYTYSPLAEDNKVDKTGFNGQDVEYGRRYAIMRKGASPEYLTPVKFNCGSDQFDGFAPRESIRIKMNGGGLNFVHGGISLQEMVVPVIEYHHLRNSSAEYQRNRQKYDTKPVQVNLLSANRKISNMIFSLNFYQSEAVSGNRESAVYNAYFTDVNGRTISDIQKIIADKSSANAQERTFRCTFNLKLLQYSSTETYYLIIQEESGLIAPQRIEFQIDIAFSVGGNNFFD